MTTDVKEKEKAFDAEQANALAVRNANRDYLVGAGDSMLMNPARFEQGQRVAALYAASSLVPKHFQNNASNCFVALKLAEQLGVDEFMLMQNLYVIHGRPGMEAKLIIALVNQRGPFTGPIQWRFEGTGVNRSCTAFATLSQTGKTCEATIPWSMVVAEGWDRPKGGRDGKQKVPSKWTTMPDQMFQYRSATFLVRLYCPEVMLGLSTVDEAEDITNGVITATIVPDIEPENEDVPAFEPPASETTPESAPEPEPSPPAAQPTAILTLDALTARAITAGVSTDQLEGALKEIGISRNRHTHKGKGHQSRLRILEERIEVREKEPREDPSPPPAEPPPLEPPPQAPVEESMASDQQRGEVYEAIRAHKGYDAEDDVLHTVRTLLGFPDNLESMKDLTVEQCRTAIERVSGRNGRDGQGQLV